jgi:ABC-2 type transport system ATP-binding protein
MGDVLDLAKRVVVIDKGEILFDGNLEDLVTSFAKEKVIRVSLSKEVELKELHKIGKVEKVEFPQITLSVPRSSAAFAAAEILQSLPVTDITIEEEPLEGIIARVFRGEVIKSSKKAKK